MVCMVARLHGRPRRRAQEHSSITVWTRTGPRISMHTTTTTTTDTREYKSSTADDKPQQAKNLSPSPPKPAKQTSPLKAAKSPTKKRSPKQKGSAVVSDGLTGLQSKASSAHKAGKSVAEVSPMAAEGQQAGDPTANNAPKSDPPANTAPKSKAEASPTAAEHQQGEEKLCSPEARAALAISRRSHRAAAVGKTGPRAGKPQE